MKREYLAQLSRDEWTRVDAIVERSRSRKRIVRDLIKNASVTSSLEKGTKSVVHGYEAQALPSVGLFYDNVLLEICPACSCVSKPALLEPFLERNLVLPMLRADYEEYPVEFAETILRYPHLSSAERLCFRSFNLEAGLCPHHQMELKKKIISIAQESFHDQAARAWLKKLIDRLLSYLDPFGDPEKLVVREFENEIRQRDLTGIRRILPLVDAVEWFRTAQAFSSVPQVSFERVQAIDRLLGKNPRLSRPYSIADINESILNGLRISYNTSVPLGTYLDIVLSRRDKIRRIVSDIVQKSRPSSKPFYSNIQIEIEKLNEEVRSISSSKRLKLLNLATSFFSDNASVILGCLSGAVLGLRELGPIGCLSGTILGGTGGKLLNKIPSIAMSSEAKPIKRSLQGAAEPVYEKLLSRYFSKNVRVVQVWQLQKETRSK